MSGDNVCIGLVSGGIDSPVAVARMLIKGWKIHPVHCSQEPITGPAAEQKTIALLRHFLQMEGPIGDAARKNLSRKLIVVPVANQLSLFTEKWNHTEYFIHMKRMFNRLADRAAQEIPATHVLTGENLGQVSSQTLGNLGSIEQATGLLPLRPLLGFDKTTIYLKEKSVLPYDRWFNSSQPQLNRAKQHVHKSTSYPHCPCASCGIIGGLESCICN